MILTLEDNISSYTDDNTPYAHEPDTESVIDSLENVSKQLLCWFSQNSVKANPDKFHLLLSNSDSNHSANVRGHIISSENKVKLLGITFENSLSFDYRVLPCVKASQKLHGLLCVSPFMSFTQCTRKMKAVSQSQFSYCPLIWMFHS